MKTFYAVLHAMLRWVLPVLLISMLVLAGCGKKVNTQTPQAPQTPLHRLIQSSYDLAAVLNAGEQALEGVYQGKLIDANEARLAARGISAALQINEQYKGRLQSLRFVDFSNKGQIIEWTNEVFASVDAIAQLGIKNPDARARLTLAFQGLSVVLSEIRSILMQIPDAPPAASPSPAATQQNQALQLRDFPQTLFSEVTIGPNSNSATGHSASAIGGEGSEGSHRADQSSARAGDSVGRRVARENDRDGRRDREAPHGLPGDAAACAVNSRLDSWQVGLST